MSYQVVAFLGETFLEVGGNFYSMPPNAKFLQMTFGEENVKVISPAAFAATLSFKPNSVIESTCFYEAPLPAGCTTKEFYKRSIFDRGFYKRFCRFCDQVIEENPTAIFWARTPSPGGIIFALRVIKAKRKLLHHICGDARDTWKDNKYRGFNKVLAYLFSKVVVKQLHKIICYEKTVNLTSGSRLFDFAANQSSHTHQFLDVVTNGVECSSLIKDRGDKINLAFIGRVVDDKGVFELLAALKLAIDKLGSVYHLTVVGSGPELPRLEKLVVDLNLNAFVMIKGVLDANGVSDVLRETDIVVIPSKTNEGFPRVIFEAWSHCIPVIVSQIGGISAFVENNRNALVVKPGSVNGIYNALLQCKDPLVYKQLKEGVIHSKEISTQEYWSETVTNIVKMEFNGV
ncbi:MAG: glycosyltransferase family 4 protein [Campylobacterales bacterium]|nr:glycosyltransferase family 4 protein [Campylobacterales bacterium]